MLSAAITAALAAALPCAPLPGADMLFARPETRVVWVGEVHGSVESPVMFADLVCAAARIGKPVVVGLERSQAEQAAWDAFLKSPGEEKDRTAFLQGPNWGGKDGRSSQAWLALAEQLRRDRLTGLVADVRMIIPLAERGQPTSAEAYEARMAGAVTAIAEAHPTAIVMVFSGNTHSMKDASKLPFPIKTFAAGLLPRQELVSVSLMGNAGAVWNCRGSDCGARPYAPYPDHDNGGRRVEPSRGPEYDFVAYTGQAFTASPPAISPIGSPPAVQSRTLDADAVNSLLEKSGPPQVEPVFATEGPLYRPDLVKWFGPVGGFFPNQAYRASVSGAVVLQCAVSAAGKLSGCVTLIESPAGWSFSSAAMAMIKKDYLAATPALGAKDGDQARILIQFPNHAP